jgi:type I restriction enzyme M protein
MLIKGEETSNISYGSTLSKDGFGHLHFDFMLSNPPYGKSWKIDEDAIVDERGKKGKEVIKDARFQVGLPSIDDGQLLFLSNMVSKMKHDTKLGSRIATVHNGSALFTGDAGGGASEIRRHIIENDWLECIIALPKNIFYNTGIPTYVWIVSNRKDPKRKGKVQLINAMELYVKLRKNLGQKNCEMNPKHIEEITRLYLDFKETDISKIYDNEFFGYNKITVERPLRWSARFSPESVGTLRFDSGIRDEMEWVFEHCGEEVYSGLEKHKERIESHLSKQDIKLKLSDKSNLLSQEFWLEQLGLMQKAEQLREKLGDGPFDDYNEFEPLVQKAVKDLKLEFSPKEWKTVLEAVRFKNEDAERVIKKIGKDGTVAYEADADLRDYENVPLSQDIGEYFEREVLAHVPDAWMDETKTVKGYEISFTRYFYTYVPPRSLEEITAEILALEKETDGILSDIVNS